MVHEDDAGQPETETDAPTLERSAADRVYGPPPAVRLAFDRIAPTLALAVPLAIGAIAAGLLAMTVFAGQLAIVNGSVAAVRPGPDVLGAGAILVAALALALGFGLTAATIVLLARIDGRRVRARAAWAGAARRPGSVALATIVSLVQSVVVAGVAVVLLPLLPIAGIAAGVALVAVAIVVAPLLLAWPRIVGGRVGLGEAIAWAWRSPRAVVAASAEPFGSPRRAIVATVLLTGVVSVVLTLLGGLLPAGWWTPVVQVALALVPAALAQVLLAAVAVRGVALRLEGPHAPEVSDRPSTQVSPSRIRRTGPLAGIAVLLVPAVMAGVLLAANPWQVPAYAAADVSRVWQSPQLAAWSGGTALLSRLGGEDSTVRLCSGATCGPEHDMRSILPSAIASATDGGLLSATWYPVEADDPRGGRFELSVVHSSPSALEAWSEPVDADADDDDAPDESQTGLPGDERVLGGLDVMFRPATGVFDRSNESLMAVAIDTSGESPVIASIVRPVESPEATLAIDVCADAECSVSQRTTVDLTWGSWSTNSTTLDVASAPDGSTVVSLADRADDDGEIALRLVTVAPDGATTVETLDADVPGEVVTDLDASHGAQVAIGADGLPVVLLRAVDRATLRLLTCTDAACTDAEIVDVVPETELLHTPALAIDATGRPLIGTIDDAANVALLSCDDAACTTTTSIALTGAVPTQAGFSHGFALALDDDGRPLVAVGVRRSGATGAPNDSGTVIACVAARCGAR